MKNILLSLLVVLSLNSFAHADEVVLSVKHTVLPVALSATTVKLSQAGYSMPLVKVLVPALADITVLDHRNVGEGAPCMANYTTRLVDSVLQGNPRTEKVNFKVTLSKTTTLAEGVCYVLLTEQVDAVIGGFAFTHSRSIDAPNRDAADCR